MPQEWTDQTEVRALALSVAANIQAATLAVAEDQDSELDPLDAFDQSVAALRFTVVDGQGGEMVRAQFGHDLMQIMCDGPAAPWFPRMALYPVKIDGASAVKAEVLSVVSATRAWCEEELAPADDDTDVDVEEDDDGTDDDESDEASGTAAEEPAA